MSKTERMAQVAAKLRETSFYRMPASTQDNHFTGGLFAHSVEVWNNLEKLTSALNLIWQDPSSPFVIAMLHDAYKIDAYYFNPDYLCWEQSNMLSEDSNRDLSLKIAEDLGIELTDEEKACITGDLSSPYHNVLCTQIAERMATYKDDPIKEERRECCICGEPLQKGEHGNNPAPLRDEGVCCDHCHFHRVIPARLEDKTYEE